MGWLDKYRNLKSYQQDKEKLDVTTRVEAARKILGDKRVISQRQARLELHDDSVAERPAPFSESILRSSAYANAHQDADWRLIYSPGYRPRAICDLPVLERSECRRWHLINWRPFALGESFEQQEALIKKFGCHYQRVHEAVVADCLLLLSEIHNEVPLAGYAHCGRGGSMKTCYVVSSHGLSPGKQEIEVRVLDGTVDQTWGVLVERLP